MRPSRAATSLDRRDDVRVGAAAADVAAHQLADIVVGPGVSLGEQADGRADLAGGAIAALEGIVLDERRLHGVQLAPCGQPLDGRDRLPACMTASVRQELMRRPSTSTVQAPHWP